MVINTFLSGGALKWYSFTSIGLPDANSRKSATKRSRSKAVGKSVAEKALAAGINQVVFDRNGYLYHGRVKSLAEGAREAGLNF